MIFAIIFISVGFATIGVCVFMRQFRLAHFLLSDGKNHREEDTLDAVALQPYFGMTSTDMVYSVIPSEVKRSLQFGQRKKRKEYR